jgi:hypothetical protein
MFDRLPGRLSKHRLRAATVELCEAGLLTCTRGKPSDEGATYALGWFPLDKPEQFSPEVQARHARNLHSFVLKEEKSNE